MNWESVAPQLSAVHFLSCGKIVNELQIRPNDMTLDVVPAQADVVATVWIYTNPQQLAFDARTGETTSCVLIVPIGKIPEQIVTPHIQVVCDGCGIPM